MAFITRRRRVIRSTGTPGVVAAATGPFNMAFPTTNLYYNPLVAAAQGSFTENGQAATLTYSGGAASGYSLIAAASGLQTSSAIDTTGANLIVVLLAGDNTSSITDSKSNTWTNLSWAYNNFFYCYNPSVGSGHTVTCSVDHDTILVAAFSGAVASPYNSDGSHIDFTNASSPQATNSITPPANNALVIAGWALTGGNGASGYAASNGFTIAASADVTAGNYGGVLAYLVQGTAASINSSLSWTGTAGSKGNGILSFKSA